MVNEHPDGAPPGPSAGTVAVLEEPPPIRRAVALPDPVGTVGDVATAETAFPGVSAAPRTPRRGLSGRTMLAVAACAGALLVAVPLTLAVQGGGPTSAGNARAVGDPPGVDLDGSPDAGSVPLPLNPSDTGGAPTGSGPAATPGRGSRPPTTGHDRASANGRTHDGASGPVAVNGPSGSGKSNDGAAPSTGKSVGGKAPSGTNDTKSASTKSASKPAASTTTKSTGTTSNTTRSAAVAKPVPGVMIYGFASNRCIDIVGDKGKDGSPLEIQNCAGKAWQKWEFKSDGTVRSMGLCMDAAWGSDADGTVVQLVKCNGSGAQQFRLNAAHDLVNVQADKCVDVKDEHTQAGSRLQLWSCTGRDNQKWATR
ncbi:Ricin-type beta-trefoil lectin domain-containing protein [Actinacidiphila alni]|uniref:Ricin-type beta-trefoil lectin domain-containing protein n=1 Tax=Actinacidiphila alni TaxID=380248 RepID=A0A1I2J0I6_9ACTN|nr:RICIN domain-containing protein [Actinacidiphila alni]SFF47373.1 Ricin-type beta-trefoil lectin domain-containing protein [Actinacidiphila alni]